MTKVKDKASGLDILAAILAVYHSGRLSRTWLLAMLVLSLLLMTARKA